ncbi:hypothetical protein LOC68_09435 [Blastopirellula sp. JC732]|uniref:Cysteine protease StiP N-terminal domain-containing protein n=1 Tax=Blastopirellula sediminis TaxID=2894196 RepID=A0A9X1SJ13_9BACT|nr:cysteine protease StiP domain-containing protein [Blastopirellula sediminis]MCC9608604.1 hypothetical protein [Blastopirellula sediminis]MCC9628619.1 hypothetical protein [Blastopirellula sediminis]
MSNCFPAALWNQSIYASLAEEVHPYASLDRFRKRTVGYTGDQSFWATPSPEPKLNRALCDRLATPLPSEDPICVAAANLALEIAKQFEPSELLFVAILRAGVPVVEWLTSLLPGSVGVATSLFVGHGIDRASYANIQADYPTRKIVFVDGWTGKGGVAGELARHGLGPLAVLSDPWRLATFRGTQEDILSPSACFTGPTTLGFSRTFTREPDQSFAAYQFPDNLLEPTITQAWMESCPSGNLTANGSRSPERRHVMPPQETPLRVHSNEVCRALINSNPSEIMFACTPQEARERFELLLELADSQNIPQLFSVKDLASLNVQVACTLRLQAAS